MLHYIQLKHHWNWCRIVSLISFPLVILLKFPFAKIPQNNSVPFNMKPQNSGYSRTFFQLQYLLHTGYARVSQSFLSHDYYRSDIFSSENVCNPNFNFCASATIQMFFFIRSTSACDINICMWSQFQVEQQQHTCLCRNTWAQPDISFSQMTSSNPSFVLLTCHSPCAISPSPLGANGSPQPGCSNLFCHPELFKGALSKCKKKYPRR